jgi:hypothetical protein
MMEQRQYTSCATHLPGFGLGQAYFLKKLLLLGIIDRYAEYEQGSCDPE